MPQLKVDLQEGFAGELVILRLDGKELWRASPTTRTQIGLAETRTFEVRATADRALFEVEIPSRSVWSSYGFVPGHGELSVGVSVEESSGAVSFRASTGQFGYV